MPAAARYGPGPGTSRRSALDADPPQLATNSACAVLRAGPGVANHCWHFLSTPGEGEALPGRPFQQFGESSRRYLSLQVGQTGAHHVDDHRQRVLSVEFAEQSFDYVGVAELSHQMIVHFQQ